LSVLALVLFLPGCRLGQGPDSIFSGAAYAGETRDACATYCHNSANPPNPLASGAIGKHRKHVIEKKIACGACHHQYKERLTHFDGTLQATGMIFFDSLSPAGAYNDSTDRCSSLDCHGSKTWF
jgi:hypothetical protein